MSEEPTCNTCGGRIDIHVFGNAIKLGENLYHVKDNDCIRVLRAENERLRKALTDVYNFQPLMISMDWATVREIAKEALNQSNKENN